MKDRVDNIVLDLVEDLNKGIDTLFDPSVEKGTMGGAIFYFFCYKHFKKEIYFNKGLEMINKSISILSEVSNKGEYIPAYKLDCIANILSSFGKGLLFIMHKLNIDIDLSPYLRQVSEALEYVFNDTFLSKDYDLSSGKLSFGYFFLNNYFYYKDDRSKTILVEIYNCIKRDAKYDNKGNVYWNSPMLNNVVYLGVSHGSAMIINFIVKLLDFNIITKDEISFLEKSVGFVYSKKRDFEEGYFPDVITEEVTKKETQFTLCYGDLGIVYVLESANIIIKNNNHQKIIISMLETIKKRENNLRYTFDASIIYGASGIFNVFKSLNNRKTNDYNESINYWHDQIINNIENKNICFIKDKNDLSYKYSLGWGISGVGISLMLGINDELPSVNELLFIGM